MQFKAIAGHQSIKNRLVRSVQENRISHAQLFSGPEGAGALALAVAYAQFISCTDKEEHDSCGKCNSCLKMEKLIHPDLHFSLPVNWEKPTTDLNTRPFLPQWRKLFTGNFYLGLEDWLGVIDIGNKQPFISNYEAREQIKTIGFKAFESEYKFLIIWLPEKMRVEGANSFLKTLEEPPDKTLIILVTQDYDNLLKTILSRTQLIKIPAYSAAETASVLQGQTEYSAEKCRLSAEIGEGNIVQARWLLENGEEADAQLELFRGWMLHCYGFNIGELLKTTELFAKESREWQKGFFAYALYMIRQTMLMNHRAELNRLTESEGNFLSKFSKFFHPGNYGTISGYINDASIHIERNAHSKILFFDLSLLISDVFRKEK